MTQNSALKKAARRYAEERNVPYTEALRRVKHLKKGDKVRVTIPGLCRFEGIVMEDEGPSTHVVVKRCDDSAEMAHMRDNIEFLEREGHRPHPPGWKKKTRS